jgi:hypothetical protein
MDAVFILLTLGFWGAMALMVCGLDRLRNPVQAGV